MGAVDDPTERAADRFAAATVRALSAGAAAPITGVGTAGGLLRRQPASGCRCAACCGGEAAFDTLRRKPHGGGDAGSALVPAGLTAAVRGATTGGQPLAAPVRARLEVATGRDMSAVRVRADAAAAATATALNARAYTLGPQIVFAPGEFAPETPAGQRLLAHEIGHVAQQGAAPPLGAAPAAPTTSAPSVLRRQTVESGGLLGDTIDAALGLLPDWFAQTLRTIRREGIVGYLTRIVADGVQALFGALADVSPALGQAITAVDGIGTRIAAIMSALASGECGPLFAAIEQLKTTVGDAAGAAWQRITDFFRPVGDFFADIWARFGAPTVAWLSDAASGAWVRLQQLGHDLWEQTAPVRAYAGFLWERLKRWIGIGEEADSEDGNRPQGILGWLTSKANEAWTALKRAAEPVTRPIGQLVDNARELLPLQAITDLQATITEWLSSTAASVESLSQPETTGSEDGQTSLRGTLLPALTNIIGGLRGGVATVRSWAATAIGGLAGHVIGLLDAIRASSLFGALSSGLAWLRDAAGRVTRFATEAVAAAFGLVDRGLELLGGFARRMLDSFLQVASTVADLPGRFADLVLGPLWRLIPACIRNPVVAFITNQILRRIPVFSQLLDVPDFWNRCTAAAMTIIRQLFVDGNIGRALFTFFSAMLSLIGLPPDLVTSIIAKAATAVGDILRDPIGFLLNLLAALKNGFMSFFGNALTHLVGGVSGWLFAQAERAGLRPPQEFSIGEVFRFILDVLGLGLDFLIARIERISPPVAGFIRRGVAFVAEGVQWLTDLMTEGPAALWRHLTDQLSNLWNTVVGAVVGWVSNTVMAQMVPRLLSMLDPSGIGAVVNSLIAIYRAIESAVEYLRPMLEIVKSVLDGVGQIARGALEGAAAFVETALARAVPIVVGFLANQVGLGSLGRRIGETVEALRERVAGAVDWLLERGRAALTRFTPGRSGPPEAASAADTADVCLLAGATLEEQVQAARSEEDIVAALRAVRQQLAPHGLRSLDLVRGGDDSFQIEAQASPRLPLFNIQGLIPRGTIPSGRAARMVSIVQHARPSPLQAVQALRAEAERAGHQRSSVLGYGQYGGAVLPNSPVLPQEEQAIVTWNTGNLAESTENITHAERQFMAEMERRQGADPTYYSGISALSININLSPCAHCCDMLKNFAYAITSARRSSGSPPPRLSIAYDKLYFGSTGYRHIATSQPALSSMQGAGWRIHGDNPPPITNVWYGDLHVRRLASWSAGRLHPR